MNLVWLQNAVPGDSEQHFCIVDDLNQIGTFCGHRFLVATRAAEPETPKCAECQKIDDSGEELRAADAHGRKVLIRPAHQKPRGGSQDTFYDITEQLGRMGCVFTLMAAQPGAGPKWFANVHAFGHEAINAMERESQAMFEQLRILRNEMEEKQRRNGE